MLQDYRENAEVDDGAPVPSKWTKYHEYTLEVDDDQDDKASEIQLCSFARPHMRAFHCSWFSFFVAFFVWFALAPLLPEIRATLQLTKQDLWDSTIANFGSVIFIRFLLGPLCDKYGPRVLFAVVLCLASIPTACIGLIQNAQDLLILRTFIGIAGGSFVMCQYWTTSMFTREVVGTANAMSAGWGNLGAGVTQLVIGSFLFPLFKQIFSDKENPEEYAWRYVCIVPAVVAFITGIGIYFISDDYPKGNSSELKAHGVIQDKPALGACTSATFNFNTWLLAAQYACCFGVELTMNSASVLYFKDEFGLSTESAAAIASIFGWMNLFARGVGGFVSDHANVQNGMRGRLYAQALMLAVEGILVIVFSRSSSLGGAIVVLVIFSLFVQASEGSTYGIVPYIDENFSGATVGLVGGGGNIGAVIFSVMFREMEYKDAFLWMGITVLCSSILTIFIVIRGESNLLNRNSGDEDFSEGDYESEIEGLKMKHGKDTEL